jgi:hypothetical protein
VSGADRWAEYEQRKADEEGDRANLAAMRRGQLPAGWVYGLNDKHQEEFDEQRRILLESAKQDAHNFAAELARRVRASGVEALWQDGWPNPVGRE